MTEIRRHLQRRPHLMFVELCPSCNENFLDKEIYDQYHGAEGQFCDIMGSQPRGQGQLKQWRLLCDQLKERLSVKLNVSNTSFTMKFLSPT